MSKPYCSTLAFDPGYGNVKICGPAGRFVIPSSVATEGGAVAGRMAGLRTTRPPLQIEFDGGSFYVGAGAHAWGRPVENLDFDRLTGAPEMRALFYGLLSQYGGRPSWANLIVGLPVASLVGDQAPATKRAVGRWLRGSHRWRADGEPMWIEIEGVSVTSQPVGALFDFLLDEATYSWVPEHRALFKKEIGIIGVGMNTVDMLVVKGGRPVQRFIGGENVGVRRLLELCDGHRLYSLGELDERLRANQLDTAGNLDIWRREVLGHVERLWSEQFRRFARVIVVGGGALLLRSALLTRFEGRAWVPDDPIISTARGLYKWARMKEGKS